MGEQSKADLQLEMNFLNQIRPDYFKGLHPPKTPFVKTKELNHKGEGCFICGRKNVTKHHILHGRDSTIVWLCWRHHQIMHGVALRKYTVGDIRTCLFMGKWFGLFKREEAGVVEKKLLMELDRRLVSTPYHKTFKASFIYIK